MKPASAALRGKSLRQLAAEYHAKQQRKTYSQKEWVEVDFHGLQRVTKKRKPREWITLFQKSGISLQLNPAYLDFRLWLFSEYGKVGIDLDIDKKNNIARALGIYRLLISNVPSHGVAWRSPKRFKIEVKLYPGDRKRLSTAVDKYLSGGRKRKSLP